MYGDLRILTGTAHPELAKAICAYLGVPLGQADIKQFSNENIFIQIKESVRSQDVFIIQPLCSPVNYNIMELLIFLDTAKRASAGRITAVIPYYAYGRTDKKDQPRVPITARLLADLITVAGASRVLTMDLHARQIQGFFNIPVDELPGCPLLARHFVQKDLRNTVIVAPDIGAAKRARDFADTLNIKFAIINKRRHKETREVTVEGIIGNVARHHAILVDEEIERGGSMLEAAKALKDAGARDIYACATHAVLSRGAVKRLASFPFLEIVVTDTVPVPPRKRLPNMVVIPVASYLGDVIRAIHLGESVGALLGE